MDNNAERAARGSMTYAHAPHDDNDPITNIYDIVADLLHFADTFSGWPDLPGFYNEDGRERIGAYVARMALQHYEAEIEPDGYLWHREQPDHERRSNMDIADRALAALEADQEARQAADQAATLRSRASAIVAIDERASDFGIDHGEVIAERGIAGKETWIATAEVEPDLTLLFRFRSGEIDVEVQVRACDQLYWDLPPGQEKKGPGGGSYGCNGLNFFHEIKIGNLVDLGKAVQRIRHARELWRKRHCREQA